MPFGLYQLGRILIVRIALHAVHRYQGNEGQELLETRTMIYEGRKVMLELYKRAEHEVLARYVAPC